jgi:hypothetical protein
VGALAGSCGTAVNVGVLAVVEVRVGRFGGVWSAGAEQPLSSSAERRARIKRDAPFLFMQVL